MIPDNARDIYETLLERTRRGDLHWEPTFVPPEGMAPERDYLTVLADYSVRIGADSGGVIVVVLDGGGRTVIDFTLGPSDLDYPLLDELLEAIAEGPALRQAALDNLRRALATA